jgi:hypothetical protein
LLSTVVVVACELEEIPVDEGDPITVVHAVMRPDLPQQWVLVELSLTGALEESQETGFVPGSVGRPVSNAVVTVANTSFRDDPCGTSVTFDTQPQSPFAATNGVYWSPVGCPSMRPGDTLELRVEAPSGDVVTGSTVVPGINSVTLSAGGREELMPEDGFLFNRDTDTLIAVVDPVGGRALHVDVYEQIDQSRCCTSSFFVDSTAVTLPGTIPNIFEGDFDLDDEVPDLFRAGAFYGFTTAWTDQNYFDFARSMNSPLSGRGFINNLTGGMGLFGSMVAVVSRLRVTGTIDDPIEGRYRLTGEVAGVTVDVIWELYVRERTRDALAGLLEGTWVLGPVATNTSGDRGGGDGLSFRVSGSQDDPNDEGAGARLFLMGGRIDPAAPFPVTVLAPVLGEEEYVIEGRRLP